MDQRIGSDSHQRDGQKLAVNKSDDGVTYLQASTVSRQGYLSCRSERLRERPISSADGGNNMFQGFQELFLAMCQDTLGIAVDLARHSRIRCIPMPTRAFVFTANSKTTPAPAKPAVQQAILYCPI